jgi:hypothetical protein
MTPTEVLNHAADLIERDGWWNGQGQTPIAGGGGPLCAVMALDEVLARDATAPIDETFDALDAFIGIGEGWIEDWNDRQPNGATVCAALRACAKSLL